MTSAPHLPPPPAKLAKPTVAQPAAGWGRRHACSLAELSQAQVIHHTPVSCPSPHPQLPHTGCVWTLCLTPSPPLAKLAKRRSSITRLCPALHPTLTSLAQAVSGTLLHTSLPKCMSSHLCPALHPTLPSLIQAVDEYWPTALPDVVSCGLIYSLLRRNSYSGIDAATITSPVTAAMTAVLDSKLDRICHVLD